MLSTIPSSEEILFLIGGMNLVSGYGAFSNGICSQYQQDISVPIKLAK